MKPIEFSPFQIKGYNLFRVIGKGEFGKVYLATDRNKFEVAVKEVIDVPTIDQQDGVAIQPQTTGTLRDRKNHLNQSEERQRCQALRVH